MMRAMAEKVFVVMCPQCVRDGVQVDGSKNVDLRLALSKCPAGAPVVSILLRSHLPRPPPSLPHAPGGLSVCPSVAPGER